MAVLIAGVFWQPARSIRECHRRRAAVGRPAADAHRGRERVARGGGALGLLRRRRRLPGLPAAATERVEGHVSRGLLVLPTDEESYANPPSIWRSVPPSGRE